MKSQELSISRNMLWLSGATWSKSSWPMAVAPLAARRIGREIAVAMIAPATRATASIAIASNVAE